MGVKAAEETVRKYPAEEIRTQVEVLDWLVALRKPEAVVCLLSALRFHELTTESPGSVWIAVENHSRPPPNRDAPTPRPLLLRSGASGGR